MYKFRTCRLGLRSTVVLHSLSLSVHDLLSSASARYPMPRPRPTATRTPDGQGNAVLIGNVPTICGTEIMLQFTVYRHFNCLILQLHKFIQNCTYRVELLPKSPAEGPPLPCWALSITYILLVDEATVTNRGKATALRLFFQVPMISFFTV